MRHCRGSNQKIMGTDLLPSASQICPDLCMHPRDLQVERNDWKSRQK